MNDKPRSWSYFFGSQISVAVKLSRTQKKHPSTAVKQKKKIIELPTTKERTPMRTETTNTLNRPDSIRLNHCMLYDIDFGGLVAVQFLQRMHCYTYVSMYARVQAHMYLFM